MISAFGSSVLLLLSEGAGQVCQEAHLHIEKAIIVTELVVNNMICIAENSATRDV